MTTDNNDDAGVALVALGVLALVGIGVFKILKAIGEYQIGETITTEQVATLPTPSYDEPTYIYGKGLW